MRTLWLVGFLLFLLDCAPTSGHASRNSKPLTRTAAIQPVPSDAGKVESAASLVIKPGKWRVGGATLLWFGSEGAIAISIQTPESTKRLETKLADAWVSPDGHRVMGYGLNGTITFWDVSSGAKLPVEDGERAPLPAVSDGPLWLEGGGSVLTAHEDGTVVWWGLSDGPSARLPPCPSDPPMGSLACLEADRRGTRVLRWDGARSEIWTLQAGQARISSRLRRYATWVDDGTVLVSTLHSVPSACCSLTNDGGIGLLTFKGWTTSWQRPNCGLLSTSPSGRYVLVGEPHRGRGAFTVVNTATGKESATFRWEGSPCPSFVWRGGSRGGLAVIDQGNLKIWSEELKVERIMPSATESPLCSSNNGRWLWAGGTVLDWETGTVESDERMDISAASCEWSKDDSAVLLSGMASKYVVWERDNRQTFLGGTSAATVRTTRFVGDEPVVASWEENTDEWICLDGFPRRGTTCAAMTEKHGKTTPVVVSSAGWQNVSGDPITLDRLFDRSAELRGEFEIRQKLRFCASMRSLLRNGSCCSPSDRECHD